MTLVMYKFPDDGTDTVDCDIVTEAVQRDDDVADDAVVAVMSRSISKRLREGEE